MGFLVCGPSHRLARFYAAGEVFDQLFEGEPFVSGVVFLEFCDDGFNLADFLKNGGHAVFEFFGGDEVVVHCFWFFVTDSYSLSLVYGTKE